MSFYLTLFDNKYIIIKRNLTVSFIKSKVVFKSVHKQAFTLAEIIVTLTILGVIAAVTIPSSVNNARQREFVTKAKKTYAALERATELWQIENGCVDNIEACISASGPSPSAFNEIAENLNISKRTSYVYRLDDVECNDEDAGCNNGVKQKNVNLENLQQNDWLPDRTTMYNGTKQEYSWQGVSKYASVGNAYDGDGNTTGLYMLKDGTTISVQLPDNNRRSGFGFFDVNGKKGPNKVGVDVYPFGFGIPYNNINQKNANERNYGAYARNFNPYYVEDNGWDGYGMCGVRNGSRYASCPNNSQTNPTVYLLNTNKIPNM